MEELFLTVEQCLHLQKDLGYNMSDASFCHKRIIHDVYKIEAIKNIKELDEFIPTYTLQEVLDRLLFEISDEKRRYELFIDFPHNTVFYYNFASHKEFKVSKSSHKLLDSAYEMLCWEIEKGLVSDNRELDL